MYFLQMIAYIMKILIYYHMYDMLMKNWKHFDVMVVWMCVDMYQYDVQCGDNTSYNLIKRFTYWSEAMGEFLYVRVV